MTSTTSRRRTTVRLSALMMVFALLVAACGGGGAGDTTTTTAAPATTTTAAPGTTTTTEPAPTGPQGTLVIAVPAEHLTLDPHGHRHRHTQVIARQVHDNPVYFDDVVVDQLYDWALATGIEQVDELTWDMTLREGVIFHDGTPFTAEAVVYSYERLFDPELNSPRATMGSQSLIESVEAIDDYTVRYTTSEPVSLSPDGFPIVLGAYSQEILLPGHYDGLSAAQAADHPTVGTGPFKSVEWVKGQFIRLEANEDHWRGAPKLKEIIFRTIPEASTQAAELIAGNVDLLTTVDADTLAQLAGQSGIETQSIFGTAMTMLQMQVTEGRIFEDVDLRIGVNHAIDRQTVVDNLFRGLAVVETQLSPVRSAGEANTGYEDDWEGYTYDPDRARELLAPLVGTPIELYAATTQSFQAEVVAEQLRGVGLTVSVITVDSQSFAVARDAGEYDLWIQTYGGLPNIRNNWETHFTCGLADQGINRTGFCRPELDALAASSDGLGPEDATPILRELGQELNADPPWVPLWTLDTITAYRDYVKGYVLHSSQQMRLWSVSVEK